MLYVQICFLATCQRGNRANKTPYLRSDVMVFTTRGPKLGDPVCSCPLSVEEDLTGEQALIRFLV